MVLATRKRSAMTDVNRQMRELSRALNQEREHRAMLVEASLLVESLGAQIGELRGKKKAMRQKVTSTLDSIKNVRAEKEVLEWSFQRAQERLEAIKKEIEEYEERQRIRNRLTLPPSKRRKQRLQTPDMMRGSVDFLLTEEEEGQEMQADDKYAAPATPPFGMP